MTIRIKKSKTEAKLFDEKTILSAEDSLQAFLTLESNRIYNSYFPSPALIKRTAPILKTDSVTIELEYRLEW